MTPEELFEIWAPRASVWSPWAKPVLFASSQVLSVGQPQVQARQEDLSWVPQRESGTALVLDLPGPLSVSLGAELAGRGYRPVPLFNNVPGPQAVVDVRSVLERLIEEADGLSRLRLPPEAPPAFLIDTNRMPKGVRPNPGQFDNRWLVFPQDFPSATLLKGRGISHALLVQTDDGEAAEDLAHVLLRWQEAGVSIQRKLLLESHPANEIRIQRPSWFRSAWYGAITRLKLRRHNAGGFGAVVPQPSSGGYG